MKIKLLILKWIEEGHPVIVKICDGEKEEPLENVTVLCSVMFGPKDRQMVDMYIKGKEKYPHKFIKEFTTDSKGKLQTSLVEGDYILDIYRKKDDVSAEYLRQEVLLEVYDKVEEKVFKITARCGQVKGHFLDEETKKGIPNSTVLIRIIKKQEKKKICVSIRIWKENFRPQYPAGKKLKVFGAFEGYETEIIETSPARGDIKEVTLTARRKKIS